MVYYSISFIIIMTILKKPHVEFKRIKDNNMYS